MQMIVNKAINLFINKTSGICPFMKVNNINVCKTYLLNIYVCMLL